MRNVILVMLSLWCTTRAFAQQEKTQFESYLKQGAHIAVPDYLVEVNDLSPEAILQFANSLNETYTMVVEESVSHENFLSINFLPEIMKAYQQKLSSRGVEFGTEQQMIIGGVEAIQIEAMMSVENVPYDFLITFVKTNKALYKIYSWTLTHQKQNYFNDFRKTANSFAIR